VTALARIVAAFALILMAAFARLVVATLALIGRASITLLMLAALTPTLLLFHLRAVLLLASRHYSYSLQKSGVQSTVCRPALNVMW
jgi:hypothetical protein